ncbi:MAG: DnaD domain protein [Lactovum sp.]
MRPGFKFSILNNQKISFDELTFTELYLPILGKTAFSLYCLLRTKTEGKFSDLLEVLNIGQPYLEKALDRLMAMSLLRLYEKELDYEILLRSPLTFEVFLADEVFRNLLISKIGQKKVDNLYSKKSEGQEITKKFSDIFSVNLELDSKQAKPSDKIDLQAFKKLMEDRSLSFSNEAKDLVDLYSLAEKFHLDWYALFKLAEETLNANKTINTQEMLRRQTTSLKPLPQLSDAYLGLLSVAKSEKSLDFLKQLKQQIGGNVLSEEIQLLNELKLKNVKEEVKNILIHYVLVQKGNSNMSSKYCLKIMSDWNRNKIYNAEAALQYIINFNKKENLKPSFKTKTNVKEEPKWSNPDYKEKATRAELEAFKKELEGIKS